MLEVEQMLLDPSEEYPYLMALFLLAAISVRYAVWKRMQPGYVERPGSQSCTRACPFGRRIARLRRVGGDTVDPNDDWSEWDTLVPDCTDALWYCSSDVTRCFVDCTDAIRLRLSKCRRKLCRLCCGCAAPPRSKDSFGYVRAGGGGGVGAVEAGQADGPVDAAAQLQGYERVSSPETVVAATPPPPPPQFKGVLAPEGGAIESTINSLEEAMGVDLDGDGDVGQPGHGNGGGGGDDAPPSHAMRVGANPAFKEKQRQAQLAADAARKAGVGRRVEYKGRWYKAMMV